MNDEMHFTLQELDWVTGSGGLETARVELSPGSTCENPLSTKSWFVGPETLKFTKWPDGGIDVSAESQPFPATVAAL